jgi:hypothetical protein
MFAAVGKSGGRTVFDPVISKIFVGFIADVIDVALAAYFVNFPECFGRINDAGWVVG